MKRHVRALMPVVFSSLLACNLSETPKEAGLSEPLSPTSEEGSKLLGESRPSQENHTELAQEDSQIDTEIEASDEAGAEEDEEAFEESAEDDSDKGQTESADQQLAEEFASAATEAVNEVMAEDVNLASKDQVLGEGAQWVAAYKLHVRQEPGLEAPVVRTLRKGDKVSVLERRGSWARINEREWVSATYLSAKP